MTSGDVFLLLLALGVVGTAWLVWSFRAEIAAAVRGWFGR